MEEEEKIELKARQLIQEEIKKYREFLQYQFKHIVWLFGTIFLAGGIVFTYLIGSTKSDITNEFESKKTELIEEINREFLKYEIDKKINETLLKRMEEAVELKANSASTQAIINEKVKNEIEVELSKSKSELDQATREISDKFSSQISIEFEANVNKLANLDSNKLIKSVAIPKGAVLAFNLQVCPAGWLQYKEAEGRVIVGGSRNSVGSLGGSDTHTLSAAELPPHSHTGVISNFEKAPSKILSYQEGYGALVSGQGQTGMAGSGKAFSLMQPYLKLLICVKQ